MNFVSHLGPRPPTIYILNFCFSTMVRIIITAKSYIFIYLCAAFLYAFPPNWRKKKETKDKIIKTIASYAIFSWIACFEWKKNLFVFTLFKL